MGVFVPVVESYVLGARIQKVLLCTHNKCYGWKIKKIIINYALLSAGLPYVFGKIDLSKQRKPEGSYGPFINQYLEKWFFPGAIIWKLE